VRLFGSVWFCAGLDWSRCVCVLYIYMSGGQVNLIVSGCRGVLYNMQRLCSSVWFSFAGAEMGGLCWSLLVTYRCYLLLLLTVVTQRAVRQLAVRQLAARQLAVWQLAVWSLPVGTFQSDLFVLDLPFKQYIQYLFLASLVLLCLKVAVVMIAHMMQ
jgi:hypothetical protein